MNFINYFTNAIIPCILTFIVFYGWMEKVNVFNLFIEGAKEGVEIVIKIFPTLIGLFLAIGMLRSSGVIDCLVNVLNPVLKIFNFPKEVIPLAILRPISGSSSIAVGTDIMKKYGVDSKIGIIASTIMGSTETTLYTIAVYTSIVNVKKSRGILIAALIGDVVGMLISVEICRFMS